MPRSASSPLPIFAGPDRADCSLRRHRLSAIRHPDGDRPAVDGRLHLRRVGQAHPDHSQYRRGGDLRHVHPVLPRVRTSVAASVLVTRSRNSPRTRISSTCSSPASSSAASWAWIVGVLIKGFLKIFVPLAAGSVVGGLVGTLVGSLLGLGAYHTFFFIVVPIMAGGVGEGAIPLSIGYSQILGQPQGDLFAAGAAARHAGQPDGHPAGRHAQLRRQALSAPHRRRPAAAGRA